MALGPLEIEAIRPHVKGDVLCLSYPDIVMHPDEVQEWFGYAPERFTKYGKRHGRKHDLPDTDELFEKLGAASVKYVDVHASRGREEIIDLNYPRALGRFDLVIDPGTTEHCFNIAQAWVNAASAVKVDGVIFHLVPMVMVNHGFWSVSPTAFHDFYTQNGWEVLRLLALGPNEAVYDAPQKKRFLVKESEWRLMCIARRLTPEPMKYPTQTKYLKNPSL